jgi:hypothetical protein
MTAFYLPLTVLHPKFDGESVVAPPYTVAKRKWEVGTLDLMTLSLHHKLHLPYEAMAVMLADVHSEVEVAGDISHLEAVDMVRSFRAALYGLRVSPSVVPYVASHSLNQYAGINARDAPSPPASLHEDLRDGITSKTATVEVWPMELYMAAWRLYDRVDLTEERVRVAASRAIEWRRMSAAQKPLAALERALVASPLVAPVEQSILHLWSAIEALFPKVSTEVVFRLALYVAQLVEGSRGGDRRAYARRVRSAYNLRSRIAHGSVTDVEPDVWIDSWDIACDVYNSIHERRRLPSEDELEDEALS